MQTSWLRNSAAILITSGLAYGLGFLFWLIVARTYSAHDMGVGVTLQTAALFLAEVGAVGLPWGLVRFLPAEREKAYFVNGMISLAILVAPLMGLAFFFGLPWWAPSLAFVSGDAAFAVAFVVSVVGFAVAAIIDSAFIAERHAGFGTARMTLYTGVRLPLPILAAPILGGFGILFSWTAALMASLVFAVLVLMPKLIRGYRFRPTLGSIRNAAVLRYSVWSGSASAVNVGAMAVLPLLIVNALGDAGPAAAAYFYAAFSFATLLYLVPESFATAMFAEGSQPDSAYRRSVPRALAVSGALVAAGIVGSLIGGRFILSLFGASFPDASYQSLAILALVAPIVLANRFLAIDLRLTRQIRSLFLITTSASFAMLAIAYAIIGRFGILGAAIGFALGQCLALPMFVVARRQPHPFPARHPQTQIGTEAPRPGIAPRLVEDGHRGRR